MRGTDNRPRRCAVGDLLLMIGLYVVGPVLALGVLEHGVVWYTRRVLLAHGRGTR